MIPGRWPFLESKVFKVSNLQEMWTVEIPCQPHSPVQDNENTDPVNLYDNDLIYLIAEWDSSRQYVPISNISSTLVQKQGLTLEAGLVVPVQKALVSVTLEPGLG
jgi:hypothetical protein